MLTIESLTEFFARFEEKLSTWASIQPKFITSFNSITFIDELNVRCFSFMNGWILCWYMLRQSSKISLSKKTEEYWSFNRIPSFFFYWIHFLEMFRIQANKIIFGLWIYMVHSHSCENKLIKYEAAELRRIVAIHCNTLRSMPYCIIIIHWYDMHLDAWSYSFSCFSKISC